jgi:hypothetical protein
MVVSFFWSGLQVSWQITLLQYRKRIHYSGNDAARYVGEGKEDEEKRISLPRSRHGIAYILFFLATWARVIVSQHIG